jgi:hypothetical protein
MAKEWERTWRAKWFSNWSSWHGDAVQADGEVGLLGGGEDGVVHAVAPEGIDPRGRQVDADDAVFLGVAPDFGGGVLWILRRGQHHTVEPRLPAQPLLQQPAVVRPGQEGGVLDVRDARKEQHVIWEEDTDVNLEIAQ